MKRFLLGFLLALAIAVPAGALGAATKDALFGTVTATDIENAPGGLANLGVVAIRTNPGDQVAVGFNAEDQVQLFYGPGLYTNVAAGYADPATAFPYAKAGSIYGRHIDNDHAGLWFKTCGDPACWTLVAGTP